MIRISLRRFLSRSVLSLAALLGLVFPAAATDDVLLPSQPNLSPDGKLLAFAWRGDIWTVAATGGQAKRLTTHTGRDQMPKFSPDGKRLAFIADRGVNQQVYVMPVDGGDPIAQTAHTAGYALEGWYPDGAHLLTSGVRDQAWKRGERFFKTRVVAKLADQRRRTALRRLRQRRFSFARPTRGAFRI
ncbi:MAG: hypothetical protein QM775_23430 [Pirellulales bacterium]